LVELGAFLALTAADTRVGAAAPTG
jgi:hypothetical protein